MSREIKFRGRDITTGEWVYGSLVNNLWVYASNHSLAGKPVCEIISSGECYDYEDMQDKELNRTVHPDSVGQFTGHQIKGADLYESDIVRIEENLDGVDPEDRMTWYVVTWIKEWCMFALLRVRDEYNEYVNEGADELDTTMFWTFPLDVEDIGPSQYYLCGNIHEHPELIKQP